MKGGREGYITETQSKHNAMGCGASSGKLDEEVQVKDDIINKLFSSQLDLCDESERSLMRPLYSFALKDTERFEFLEDELNKPKIQWNREAIKATLDDLCKDILSI